MAVQLKKPLVIVNFKAYPESVGKNAVKMAKFFETLATTRNDVSIAIAAQPADISELKKVTNHLILLGQHFDYIKSGRSTGHIAIKSLKDAGAIGSLLNHSEKPLEDMKVIAESIKQAKKNNFKTIVCVRNEDEAKKVAKFLPDVVAVEPPELIAGEYSVSEARPYLIENTVKAVKKISKNILVLAGAGIRTHKDVKKAFELGAEGILVASGVVKAPRPRKALEALIKGIPSK